VDATQRRKREERSLRVIVAHRDVVAGLTQRLRDGVVDVAQLVYLKRKFGGNVRRLLVNKPHRLRLSNEDFIVR
jgi:hypothetical protein